MDYTQIIGQNIARLRREKQVKQEELANYTGVSAQAVSKWENGGMPDAYLLPKIADFFGVSVWRGLGESCAKYLRKGAKVCVIGAVGVRTYQTNSGETRAVMEVNADDVEFLSGRNENRQENAAPTPAGTPEGFTAVETDDLPF